MSVVQFSFDGDPQPSFEILGGSIGLMPFGVVFGVIVLPLALGVLARERWIWSVIAFASWLLTLSAHHSLMLHVSGLVPAKIPFPWEYVGTWILASMPAALAGLFGAKFFQMRRNREVV